MSKRLKPEDGHGEDQGKTPQEGGLDLDRFHHLNRKGVPVSVYDYQIFEFLKETGGIFVLGGVPYLYDGGAYFPDISGARLKTMIRSLIYPQFVKAPVVNRIYEMFLQAAELEIEADALNQYPPEWICFRNGFYDPVNRRMVPHDPKYRAVNQIPHEYRPEGTEETTGGMLEKWFSFIFSDKEDREMFLQFAGYCMTRDTRQQKLLILCGGGGTGKSTLIRLIEKVIGIRNISNVSLAELSQRFAAFGLLGKLLNSCADLEVTALEDTSILKKLLGEDQVKGEAKGKQPVFFRNYAKLLFSTNELPTVKAERTNGFYRRLLILNMDNVPEKRRADFFDSLETELPYFIRLCVQALERMYKHGMLKESENSVEAVKRLRCESDTVEAFLQDGRFVVPGTVSDKVKRSQLFLMYSVFCRDADRTPLKKHGFFKAIRAKGLIEIKTAGEAHFRGIKATENALKTVEKLPSGAFYEVTEEELQELPFSKIP